MPGDNCQKIKLLKLVELLRQQTDEAHPLRTHEICEKLGQMGISCERRTLGMDMKLLNQMGYEVMCVWMNREKAYYVDDRSFSVPELKILLDAVQAASFITNKKSLELIEKLAALGGSHQAEILTGNIVCFNNHKHSNESIYYNVERLEAALQNKQRASFRYFDLDERHERVYRRDGERYLVEPMALVYNEDNYYLMCWNAKHRGVTNYRVDRMDAVETLEEPVSADALLHEADVQCYTEQVFKMYNGQQLEVTLQFDPLLIGAIYDKFGEETQIRRMDETTLTATVQVQISPTFWGWLFQFGSKMRLLSPASAALAFQGLLEGRMRACENQANEKTAARDTDADESVQAR